MSQTDIYEYLKNQRRAGNDKFFTIKEVETHLKIIGCSIHNVNIQLLKLYNHGFLDIKIKTNVKGKPWYGWNRKYRIKWK